MKNSLKNRIAILCIVGSLFVIPASNSFGDDFVTSVGAGSKAVLFTFSGLADLGAGAFDGGLGGKYFLSDAIAIRAALLFAYANQVIAANPPAASTTATGTNGSASATRFGLEAAGEYHLLKTRVSPYVGAGLGLISTSTQSKSPEVGTPPPSQTTVKNNGGVAATGVINPNADGEMVNGVTYYGGLTFNIAAIGGVELFILKELSLSAEYRLGYSMTSRYDQESTTGGTTTKFKVGSASMFGITSGGALTLAVYF